jgi:hypothetical protein
MRFAIRIDWWCRPFLLFIGATPANSYVDIGADDIRMRFGPGFDGTIPRDSVVSAAPMRWTIIDGLGVSAGGQIFGLIGAPAGVVHLELRETAGMRFAGFPWTTRRVAVSLEDPRAFIDAVMPPTRDAAL